MSTKHTWRLAAVLVAGSLATQGCGSEPVKGIDDDPNSGFVGLSLDAPGVALDQASYTITGPAGFVRTGSIDLRHSTTISALVVLPSGGPYITALSGTSSTGSIVCAGTSDAFSIVPGRTANVSVRMSCREPARNGTAVINGVLNICPVVDGIAASPAEALVGGSIGLTGSAHDADGVPSPLKYQWTASSGTLSGASTANPTLTCTSAGMIAVGLTVSDGDCTDVRSATVECTGAGLIRINEVESNGGVPGDWVELYNAGSGSADISGWKFKDNDDSHAFYILPAKTIVPAGGYYLLEEAEFVFGLGATDSARLWDAADNPIDSFSWTAHATTTYGRCPNGTGSFATTASVTKGAANDCGSDAGVAMDATAGADVGTADGASEAGSSVEAGSDAGASSSFPWPGTDAVVTVDDANTFGSNLSGLDYQPPSAGSPAVLWGIQNSPSRLYRLLWNGMTWSSDTSNGWTGGKLLHYTNGTGSPDSEGLSKAQWVDSAIYVSTERDNDNNGVSRLSILRFDTGAAGTELVATHDWNVTPDLPVVGPNLGLEAITYVPDTALVAGGFFDEAKNAIYDPTNYANHGTGLFFVGLEGNGSIYAYALDHVGGGFTRVATLASGQVSIMDLAYDREVGYLWGYCDNTCGNKATVFRLGTAGRFEIGRVFDHPSTLPNSNNEGITFASEAECSAGQKSFFWADDDQLNGHAIRLGTIPCGTFF